MDTVKQFENELNSIWDFRPPVSKAKMASITKLAMKSHKYYKHIVMLVEKFISKSSSEYKIPGLYVIDSIMRQSKHQFGAKDSFGLRFTKNFEKTFLHLYQCPEEDRPKIVRVLNLWQRNEVFSSEVIQPLLALASSDTPQQRPKRTNRDRIEPQFPTMERHGDGGGPRPLMGEQMEGVPLMGEPIEGGPLGGGNLDLNTATTIIQQQQEQISALLQQQQQLQSQATSLLGPAFSTVLAQQPSGGVQQLEAISSLLQQTQQLQQLQAMQQRLANGDEVGGVPAQISNVEPVSHNSQPTIFNEAVLDDFDYSDEEDTLDRASQLGRQPERDAMSHPQPPPQPQSLISLSNDSVSPVHSSPRRQELPPDPLFAPKDAPHFPPPPDTVSLPPLGAPNSEALPFQREMGGPPLPPILDRFSPGPPPSHPNYPPPPHIRGPPPQIPPHGPPGPPREWSRQHPPPLPPHYPPPPRSPSPQMRRESRFSPPPPMMGRRSPSPPPRHRPPWRERERSSRWSPPPPPRRRSRSPPPPMLMRRGSRDRSRSPPHSRWHRVATPPEEQERRRRGVPFPREKHMTVCSTTLWVGHLSKNVSNDTVRQAFEDFGQIKSVELVQARGCAYLVMMHRNDAIRALNSLRDLKLGGTTCKLAWAPGRGVKGAGLKAFWDQEVGSSYIPWSFVKAQSDVNSMSDGGWIDSGTLSPGVTAPPAEVSEEERELEAPPAAPPAQQKESMPPQPPLPPTQNTLPPQQSAAPAPALPPQPPVPSFPQLMNPPASFQPPGEAVQHFPPRGVLNSQPMPVQQLPPFSQPSFHGGYRPPMGGGEPQPPQSMPHSPLGMGGIPHSMAPPMVPHSMAPPMGGVPHSMPPLMGGAPPHHQNLPPAPHYTQGQMPMHRPQMMPPHPHGVPLQSTPHQMMPPQPGNIRPFHPHMAPRMVSPVAQNFPHPVPPMSGEQSGPIRLFMGEPPRSRPMAPLMGGGPRPSFSHQHPIMHQGDQTMTTLRNQPPLRPLMPTSQGHILPQERPEDPQDSSLEPIAMDESTEPIPMDEEPKEVDSSTEAEDQHGPKEPLPPPEEPNEPIVPPEDKEVLGEEQTKPLDMQDQTNDGQTGLPQAAERPQTSVSPLKSEVSPVVVEDKSEPETTRDEENQSETNGLATTPQPLESNPQSEGDDDEPLATNPEPTDENKPSEEETRPKGSTLSDDDMQIETTDDEDFRIATMADDGDFL